MDTINFIVLLIGLAAGIIIEWMSYHSTTKPIGTLKIYYSDPDGPYMFLELDDLPENISTKDFVTFKVDSQD